MNLELAEVSDLKRSFCPAEVIQDLVFVLREACLA